jgi:thermostable 8-oxoguanine DNA glycosylase
MKFIWEVSESDISKVTDFVNKHKSPYVENIVNRNINQKDIVIDKDSLLRTMLMCLLSSDTDLYPEAKVDTMLSKKPFLLTYQYLFKVSNIEYALKEILMKYGITKYINKVPKYFSNNFDFLEESEWDLEKEINRSLNHAMTKYEERELADRVDQGFKGFGSKEARSFLLLLGVTKYEIPIDYQLINWLANFDFPIKFSKTALQDKLFYHFVSDGIQLLCEKARIFPCVLYASILSGSGTVK